MRCLTSSEPRFTFICIDEPEPRTVKATGPCGNQEAVSLGAYGSERIKVYREVGVKSRLEGTAGYFTVSLPLSVARAKPIPSPIRTRF